ncbi:MAG: dTMP kinase [Propionibacterium sp.]|nr:MAG: dTMP kinase [Propionibacterium sp.]
MSRGLFIVFEGGDSVGKTTQVEYLADWLAETGVDFLQTRQPGGTKLGEQIRKLVLEPSYGEVAPWAEALLYAADKAQHVYELVSPALAAGKLVISDRYVDSTLAYQGAGRAIPVDHIAQLSAWATGGLVPDLTVLLDADPQIAVSKIESKDRIEQASLEFHRSVRSYFLDLAKTAPDRYLVVNAFDERENIAAQIRQRVATLLRAD